MKENLASFHQSDGQQMHVSRCQQIMKAHPEVKQLIGRNPYTALIMLGLVTLQLSIAYWLGAKGFDYWWLALIMAYCVGAFANHALYIIIHEGTHNLIFKNRFLNKLCVLFSDIPNAFPGAVGFKTYHIRHHSHLGDYDHDADLATDWEAELVGNSWWRKAIWMLIFPASQILHTARIKSVNTWHKWMYINIALVFAVDIFVFYVFGGTALFYLFFSTLFALGLHPVGARWIQEHYSLNGDQETYSYYGPLNYLALNMGYHNEHHDFPSIPWNRLPALKKMAPEFYDTLDYHPSWTKLLINFIFNPEYSLYSRVVRQKDKESVRAFNKVEAEIA